MDIANTWRTVLCFACVLVFTLTGVTSLQCYDCAYFDIRSDSGLLDTVIGQLSRLSDTACQFNNEDDSTNVDIRNCPEPRSGNEAKCAVVKGEVSTNIRIPIVGTEVPFRYYSVERNCIEVPADDGRYDDCQDELTSLSEQFVKSVIEDYADVGNIDFDGEACYFDELTSSASSERFDVITVLMACALVLFSRLSA